MLLSQYLWTTVISSVLTYEKIPLLFVQDAAACLLTRKHEYICPVLGSLRWLSVCLRIHLKIFFSKSVNNVCLNSFL